MKKNLKITINAPVTLGFSALCFAATILGVLTGGFTNTLLFMTYHSSLASPLTWIRFFTHVLGHSGWSHLIGNVSYLLLLGPMLEEKYGGGKILGVIASAAFITGVVNYILFPSTALCGASGVVFAFILLTSFTGFREGEIPVTFLLVALLFLGQQILEGIAVKDNVSNLSHVIGGIVGSATGFSFNRRKSRRR